MHVASATTTPQDTHLPLTSICVHAECMGPREINHALERAEHLLTRGRPDAAAGLFHLVTQADPLCIRAHMGLSNCGAIVGTPPQIAARLVAAARHFDDAGDARGAHSLRAKAIAVEPNNAYHQLEHATRLVSDGRLRDAMTLLSCAAELLLASRRYDEARGVLTRVDRIEQALLKSREVRQPRQPTPSSVSIYSTLPGSPPPPPPPIPRRTTQTFVAR